MVGRKSLRASALVCASVLVLAGCTDFKRGDPLPEDLAAPPALIFPAATVPDGITGTAYSQTLTATGGRIPLSWSVTAGALPDGLSLSTSGTISGTPTTAGAFNFTVQVADTATPPQTRSQALTINIADPLSITTTALPNGSVGVAYNQTVATSGGLAPLTFSVSAGTLPAGLSLDTTTGAISGTPTTGGTSNFTVQAVDSSSPNQTASQALSILVEDLLTITAASLANGTEGVAYSQTVTTTGGSAPLTFSISAGSLPNGLAFETTTGTITGTPNVAGSFTFTVTITDSSGVTQTDSQQYTVLILGIATTNLPGGNEGVAYGPETLAVTGEVAPVAWSVSAGSLPTGLTLAAGTGVISGTPTAGGMFNFTVQATDSDSPARSDTQALSIDIISALSITTTSLADATANSAYNQPIQSTSGVAPFAWTEPTASFDATGVGAVSTACEGLTFDVSSTGIGTTVSGTPVNTGTCGPFTARVDDSSMTPQFAEQSLSITVNAGAPPGGGGNIERVSLANDGSEAVDNSFTSSVSNGGRFVAFGSNASTLVTGDTNTARDIFVRDTCRGVASGCTTSTVRVSVASDGTQSDNLSASPVITPDGRFVAFWSRATTLVGSDTNGSSDVFVHDRDADEDGIFDEAGAIATVRISVAGDGTEGDNNSFAGGISPDGRYIVFDSDATTLVAGDTNGRRDVFVHDRDVSGNGAFDEGGDIATTRVSVAGDGSQGNVDSFASSISDDGRFVAFDSNASNLVTGDTNTSRDIFVRDTCAGAAVCTPSTVRVSVASDGTQAEASTSILQRTGISGDGRFVTFSSRATNLVAGDTNGQQDIFVHDRDLDNDGIFDEAGAIATVRVTVASDGTESNFFSELATISGDGRFVAFSSGGTNLVMGDTNNVFDIFVHDRDSDNDGIFDEAGAISTIRVSVASDGAEADKSSAFPSLSADGFFVVFTSGATTLVAGDTNLRDDVFLAPTGR